MNIYTSDLITFCCSGNTWLWFHIFAAAIIVNTGFLLRFLFKITKSRQKFTYRLGVLDVFMTAIVWEIVEYLWETPTTTRMIEIYGSEFRYWADTTGDVVIPVIVVVVAGWRILKRGKDE